MVIVQSIHCLECKSILSAMLLLYSITKPDALLRIHSSISNGSAAYKSFLYSVVSTVLYIVVYEYYDDAWREQESVSHPYVMAALIAAFMFLLSSKVTFSYNRVSKLTLSLSMSFCGLYPN